MLGYSFMKPTQSARQSPSATKTIAKTQSFPETYRGLPTTLKIPTINVDTTIEPVGLTSNGDMTAPTSPTTAAWFKYGAIPGDPGNAVIAGHVVGDKGEPAVFKNLNKLKAGDTILIADSKNQIATFIVREIRTYDQHEQHDEVFSSTTGTHLNIITCAGEWDASRRHYL